MAEQLKGISDILGHTSLDEPKATLDPNSGRTAPPVFQHTGNGKGEGLMMKTARVVTIIGLGVIAACAAKIIHNAITE